MSTTALHSSWQLVLGTPSGWLFLGGASLLLLSIGVEVWCDGFELQFLKDKTLHEIEKEPPHFPSLLTLSQIICSNIHLFIIGLVLHWQISPQPEARAWMFFALFFLVIMVSAIFLELHWKGIAEASCAFSTATAAAFLLVLLWSLPPLKHPVLAITLGGLLALDILCLGLLYERSGRRTIPAVFLGTALFWGVALSFASAFPS